LTCREAHPSIVLEEGEDEARGAAGPADRLGCGAGTVVAVAASDFLSRLVADGISPALGQPVLVENRPGGGGGGNIMFNMLATSAPDGYTLGLGTSGMVVSPAVSKLSWDPVKNFAPISLLAEGIFVLVASSAIGASNVAELIAAAKANPGKFNYASDSTGTSTHLGMELLKMRMGGIDIVHVPYKGAGEKAASLRAGDTHMTLNSLSPAILAMMKEGRLRAIVSLTPKRLPELPDVQTLQEAGISGVQLTSWFAVIGPAGLPAEVQQRLNREVVALLARPEVAERIAKGGNTPRSSSPEELGTLIASTFRQWKEVAERANIRID
jgi:tripartite-type tricarboxylate transporter receptor subunit TctC